MPSQPPLESLARRNCTSTAYLVLLPTASPRAVPASSEPSQLAPPLACDSAPPLPRLPPDQPPARPAAGRSGRRTLPAHAPKPRYCKQENLASNPQILRKRLAGGPGLPDVCRLDAALWVASGSESLPRPWQARLSLIQAYRAWLAGRIPHGHRYRVAAGRGGAAGVRASRRGGARGTGCWRRRSPSWERLRAYQDRGGWTEMRALSRTEERVRAHVLPWHWRSTG